MNLSKGSQQFDKAQRDNKLHIQKVFKFEQYLALDRNFKQTRSHAIRILFLKENSKYFARED
jgi:hypothetical protein